MKDQRIQNLSKKNINLFYICIIAILLSIYGLLNNNYSVFIFGVFFSIFFAYLCGIRLEKKDGLIFEDLIKWEAGTSGIIRGFLLILILLNIGRLGTVLIYETKDSLIPDSNLQTSTETFNIKINNSNINLTKNIIDNSINNTYSANYSGINKDKLKVNLVNDYLFFKAGNSENL